MKNLLLIIIIAISFACKKETIKPFPGPTIKTSKSFTAKITFTSDSLCDSSNPIPGYYPSGIVSSVGYPHFFKLGIDTVPNKFTIALKGETIFGVGPLFTTTLSVNISTNDLNKSFTYYIYMEEMLRRPNGSSVLYKYCKQYTFHEGDNGNINFNTLP